MQAEIPAGTADDSAAGRFSTSLMHGHSTDD
jgi:hypothetical protein